MPIDGPPIRRNVALCHVLGAPLAAAFRSIRSSTLEPDSTVPVTEPASPAAGAAATEEKHVARAVLAKLALFSSLNDDTLDLLSKRLAQLETAAGAVIFEEGAPGRAMYVVLGGAVSLCKRNDEGGATHVTTVHPGGWFGEMCLLDVMSRPVTARATEDTTLLKLCPTDLRAVYRADLKMYALLVMNMARQLSRRLRAAEVSLAHALCAQHAQGPDER